MTYIQLLLLCCLVAFIEICIVYNMNKNTNSRLFVQVDNPDETLPESPYGVSRVYTNGNFGYCITKGGSVMYSSNIEKVFSTIKSCIEEINKLESVQGYIKTRLN